MPATMPLALIPSLARSNRPSICWKNGRSMPARSRIVWFLHDADLDPVRDHPRYPALLERLRGRQAIAWPRIWSGRSQLNHNAVLRHVQRARLNATDGTPSNRHPCRRRGRLQPLDGLQRSRHAAEPARRYHAELVEPGNRPARRPDRQADRRRDAGRIPKRRRRSRMRVAIQRAMPAAQCRRAGRSADRIPDGHQPRRRDRRRATICLATASTSRRGWKASPGPAVSPCPNRFATMSATSWT